MPKYIDKNVFIAIMSFFMIIMIIIGVILYSKMEVKSCFYFDREALEKVKQMHKKKSVLYNFLNTQFKTQNKNKFAIHVPIYYFNEQNEKQLLTPQKKPFCIYIQNIFLSVALNDKVDFFKFDKAFNNKVKNAEKMSKEEKFEYLKKEVKGIFVPIVDFDINNFIYKIINKKN